MYQFQGAPGPAQPGYHQSQSPPSASYPAHPLYGAPGQESYSTGYQGRSTHNGYLTTDKHDQSAQHSSYAKSYPPHSSPRTGTPSNAYQPHLGNYSPTSNQSCYNCGNPGHWAQDCPEPRRANPAGAISHRPFKRQKTSGPVITRYPPPPNYQGHTSLQRGYTHPPPGHPPYSYSNGPPTPMSTQENNVPPWQSQPNPHVPPMPRHNSQQWSPSGLPTPGSSHGSQYASPVSAHGSSQHSFVSPHQPALCHLSPRRPDSLGSTEQFHQNRTSNYDPGAYTAQPKNDLYRLPIASDHIPAAEETDDVEHVETWLEELQALDFEASKPGSGPRVSHPANPVAQPLPAESETMEAIGRLPIAASLRPGVPVSKYFRDLDPEVFELNVREKQDWAEINDDPIFAEIKSDCDAISVTELVRRLNDDTHVLPEPEDEGAASDHGDRPYVEGGKADERSRNNSRDRPRSADRESLHQGSTSLKQDIEHYQQPVSLIEQQTRAIEEARLAREAEEQEGRLAALGVTGFAKTHQLSVRRSAVPLQDKGQSPSPDYNQDKYQHTDRFRRGTQQPEHSASHSTSRRHDRSRDSSYSEESPYQNDSASHSSLHPHSNGVRHQGNSSQRSRRHRSSERDRNSASRKRKYYDGPNSSPTDAQHNGSRNEDDGESPYEDQPPRRKREQFSPRHSRQASSQSPRRKHRYPSEESDGGPKRQADYTKTERYKQKHPKVAEAYSRRW